MANCNLQVKIVHMHIDNTLHAGHTITSLPVGFVGILHHGIIKFQYTP